MESTNEATCDRRRNESSGPVLNSKTVSDPQFTEPEDSQATFVDRSAVEMRKLVVFENITLDGFMAGPKGEIDWAIRDDEVTQLSRQGQDSADLFMFGRVTYDMMAGFWPTPAGKSANPTFAGILNNTSKIAFSRTLKMAGWQNTELLADLNKDRILELKSRPGKSIMIFGSGSIVDQLASLGLIDEYQLILNPVVLGRGKRLFGDTTGKMNLDLVDANTFKSGLVFLRYRPARR
jgi:dihydrofolate reductase